MEHIPLLPIFLHVPDHLNQLTKRKKP